MPPDLGTKFNYWLLARKSHRFYVCLHSEIMLKSKAYTVRSIHIRSANPPETFGISNLYENTSFFFCKMLTNTLLICESF